jgi:hypothetical protein
MLAIFGLALVMVGAVAVVYLLQPKPAPPVDVLWNSSGWTKANGVYFDSVVIRSHGSSNVTVVVEIKDLMDSKPRISDPVTLCAGCNATVQIEAVQPLPTFTYDEYSYYTQQLANPESITVQYLSVVLASRYDDYFTAGAAGAIVVGLFLQVRSLTATKSRRRGLSSRR